MTSEFVLFMGVGKLIIYVLNKFLSDNVSNKFVNNLVSCEFCSGVWVYTILATVYKIYVLDDIFPYIPVVSEIVTGCIVSFTVHLLTIGWKEKFNVVVI